ncbi:MAG TPA: hypothetical protein H9870_05690 [Candidatus Corynebacterium avicola]|uniref:Uncharacterized protein n=1 Tax=Candidatus Corynebacterium avicola TaxID=2838527 RepID=A0A9D1RQ03_9CORY|nr:hypothetical protein [Candidatus Corynebacterium avicola]
MSELLFLLVGLLVGLAAGGATGVLWASRRAGRRPLQGGQSVELTAHEHLWGDWEPHQEADVWGSHPEHPVAFDVTQKRTCQTCGFTEFHTERY